MKQWREPPIEQPDYPTDAQLKAIRKWPIERGEREWFEYIKKIWHWPDWGIRETPKQYHISTGGWSGNEEIIGAMQSHLVFWSLTWFSSRAGGHYVFRKRDGAEK